jgi:hypothetical protein
MPRNKLPDDIRATVRRFDEANREAAKLILNAPAIFHPESAGAVWARAVIAKLESDCVERVK